jgi:hypothetical protein
MIPSTSRCGYQDTWITFANIGAAGLQAPSPRKHPDDPIDDSTQTYLLPMDELSEDSSKMSCWLTQSNTDHRISQSIVSNLLEPSDWDPSVAIFTTPRDLGLLLQSYGRFQHAQHRTNSTSRAPAGIHRWWATLLLGGLSTM